MVTLGIGDRVSLVDGTKGIVIDSIDDTHYILMSYDENVTTFHMEDVVDIHFTPHISSDNFTFLDNI